MDKIEDIADRFWYTMKELRIWDGVILSNRICTPYQFIQYYYRG